MGRQGMLGRIVAWSLLVMAPTGPAFANQAAPPPDRLVGMIGALAWPLAALIVALIFRRPLAAFVASIGGRVTRLSAFSVGIELASAKPAGIASLVEDVATSAQAAQIADSYHHMLEQLMLTEPADFASIDIGEGTEWITSRLYIAAIMLARMRGVKVFLFVETAGGVKGRLVGVADVAQLRWTLARRDPMLEGAWRMATAPLFPKPGLAVAQGPHPDLLESGAFLPHVARRITEAFIHGLQRAPGGKKLPPGWVDLARGRRERAEWVTGELLRDILPRKAFTAWASVRGVPRGQRRRLVLEAEGDFVALVDDERDRRFVRLVNRRSILEDAAASLVDT